MTYVHRFWDFGRTTNNIYILGVVQVLYPSIGYLEFAPPVEKYAKSNNDFIVDETCCSMDNKSPYATEAIRRSRSPTPRPGVGYMATPDGVYIPTEYSSSFTYQTQLQQCIAHNVSQLCGCSDLHFKESHPPGPRLPL
jgi:hypothetical protein